jgi:Ca2+-binding RTX toxin-like protein
VTNQNEAQNEAQNEVPTITSNGGGNTAAVSMAENTTAVTTVTATDPDLGQTLGYSIFGGADASKFTINSTTGALAFVTAPNFEAPTDAGVNNVYDVTVQVSDGNGGIDTQAIAVAVQDVAGVTINGTNQAQTLTGTGENDIINGRGGNDTLQGLGGNDTLNGGAGTDTATYAASVAGVSVSLATGLGSGGDAQGDTLINFENLTGSDFNDILEGNSGSNVLNGGGGADTLTGGAGIDKFLFTATADSSPSAPDLITDFVHGVDTIDFSAIDANTSSNAGGDQAFSFAGQNSNVVANSVSWYESSGNTIIQADVDANTTAEFTIVLTGVNHNLAASDFIL